MSIVSVLLLISFSIGAIATLVFIHTIWSVEEGEEVFISNGLLLMQGFIVLYFFIEKMFWAGGR